jgi:hypothetical protein
MQIDTPDVRPVPCVKRKQFSEQSWQRVFAGGCSGDWAILGIVAEGETN